MAIHPGVTSHAPCTSCATPRGHCRKDQHDALGRRHPPALYAADGDEARWRLGDAVTQLQARLPKVAALLEDAEDDILAFYASPAEPGWCRCSRSKPTTSVSSDAATSAKARWPAYTTCSPADLSLSDLKRRSPSSPQREQPQLHRRDERRVSNTTFWDLTIAALCPSPGRARRSGRDTARPRTLCASLVTRPTLARWRLQRRRRSGRRVVVVRRSRSQKRSTLRRARRRPADPRGACTSRVRAARR